MLLHYCIILGGWGIPPVTVMSDVWLLTMTGRVWTWSELTVHNQQWAASHLWCHPACRVSVTQFIVIVTILGSQIISYLYILFWFRSMTTSWLWAGIRCLRFRLYRTTSGVLIRGPSISTRVPSIHRTDYLS